MNMITLTDHHQSLLSQNVSMCLDVFHSRFHIFTPFRYFKQRTTVSNYRLSQYSLVCLVNIENVLIIRDTFRYPIDLCL